MGVCIIFIWHVFFRERQTPMRLINLGNRQFDSCGAEALYFRISKKRGVKVFVDYEYGFDSYSKGLLSDIKMEIRKLKKIEKIGIGPKYAELVSIRWEQNCEEITGIGILMEHIEGTHPKLNAGFWMDRITLKKTSKKNKNAVCGYTFLDAILLKHNLSHRDLHNENIIIDKNKNVKVLDWGVFSQ